jgi:hypothetical protein
MAKRVRRQHVISQFYLKGFANESNQLRRVTLPGDNSHLISTSDASVIKDFYTVQFPDGYQSDMFERAFNKVERPASEALKVTLAGGWPLDSERLGALASWIALQHLRAEGIRESGSQQKAFMIRLVVGVSGKQALREVIERAESRTVSDEELDWEWEDITKPGGPDLTPDNRDHLSLLMSLHDGMSRYLHDCHWTINDRLLSTPVVVGRLLLSAAMIANANGHYGRCIVVICHRFVCIKGAFDLVRTSRVPQPTFGVNLHAASTRRPA